MSAIPAIDWPTVPRPADLRRIVLWSAAELSSAIRGRVVSCVEVMTAYLDHIDIVNPSVTALVALRPRSELLEEAAEKDRLLAHDVVDGWMHGFPHAVKDLADVAGWTTSAGFFRESDHQPPAEGDDLFVERIRAAGAIFIGRTNTPEFGLGSHTYNTVYGTTRNAYDQTRTAGGSSGGAAVAVALRMLPVADGSDFMGSLRNPPGWNGVLGMRPSFGRVPSFGGDQFTLHGGVEGPIARSAQDLALLLATMSGYDPRAPLSIHDDGGSLAATTSVEPGRLRIGWLGDLGGYLAVEPEVLEVIRFALGRLEDSGATVVEIDSLPQHGSFAGVQDLWPTWLTYRHASTSASAASLYADP
ncbi:amidase family protein [Naasia lichenicola]|uniref:amidase family protein n=1 Tax=Naasia lichenicola TaxID=2565933 RepID=UPI0018EE4A21|nr:amidase family protein [Naasia lichenicola]